MASRANGYAERTFKIETDVLRATIATRISACISHAEQLPIPDFNHTTAGRQQAADMACVHEAQFIQHTTAAKDAFRELVRMIEEHVREPECPGVN